MNIPTLRTERLILRKFIRDDLEALFMIFSDEEVNVFLPWFSLKTMGDASKFYSRYFESKYYQECLYNYAICLKEDNYPIGYVNVDAYDSYDFSYGLRKEFWHKGIVTKACKAVIEQLRKDLTPNVCAVYTEKEYRCRGIAGHLLNMVVEDLKTKGITLIYLVTDHTNFYERYGWEFLCLVQGDDELNMTRMYVRR